MCFTVRMGKPEARARAAVASVVAELEAAGVLAACRELFKTVWSINIARHEPDELGDTAMSLGLQTHQNFITRAERRFLHDERESEDCHWHIEGLTLTRSGNTFVLGLNGARVSVMKAPYEHGRQLQTNQLVRWDGQSHLRAEMAARNSAALGDYRSSPPSDEPLFEDPHARYGNVRDFLLVFAAEQRATLTAAWMGVPVLGDEPLLAVQNLWWDHEATSTAPAASVPATHTTFDERDVPPLTVTLRADDALEGQL